LLIKSTAAANLPGNSPKSMNAPLAPGGTYTLQVAAVRREADALELATRLQHKNFLPSCFHHTATSTIAFRSAPIPIRRMPTPRKGLESAGFKAIVKH